MAIKHIYLVVLQIDNMDGGFDPVPIRAFTSPTKADNFRNQVEVEAHREWRKQNELRNHDDPMRFWDYTWEVDWLPKPEFHVSAAGIEAPEAEIWVIPKGD